MSLGTHQKNTAVGKPSYEHGEQTKTVIGLEINYQTQMVIKILRGGSHTC